MNKGDLDRQHRRLNERIDKSSRNMTNGLMGIGDQVEELPRLEERTDLR